MLVLLGSEKNEYIASMAVELILTLMAASLVVLCAYRLYEGRLDPNSKIVLVTGAGTQRHSSLTPGGATSRSPSIFSAVAYESNLIREHVETIQSSRQRPTSWRARSFSFPLCINIWISACRSSSVCFDTNGLLCSALPPACAPDKLPASVVVMMSYS